MVTTTHDPIVSLLSDLKARAPAGYAMAMHIRYTAPTYLFQSYPADWLRDYSEKGLVMSDPTVHWGFANEGICRWSDLVAQDSADVLQQAKAYDLNFGMTWALELNDSRSVGSLARPDREFTDEECSDILAISTELHGLTFDQTALDPETAEALEKLSVKVTHPSN